MNGPRSSGLEQCRSGPQFCHNVVVENAMVGFSVDGSGWSATLRGAECTNVKILVLQNEILLQYYSQPDEILGHGLNDSILALITYFGVYFNV